MTLAEQIAIKQKEYHKDKEYKKEFNNIVKAIEEHIKSNIHNSIVFPRINDVVCNMLIENGFNCEQTVKESRSCSGWDYDHFTKVSW